MSVPIIFDRAQLRRQRDRAAATLSDHDFLFREAAERLGDRLLDTVRRFDTALDVGCHNGEPGRIVAASGRVGTLFRCDLSPCMAATAGGMAVAADEEALPFAHDSFDLIMSCLSLHWVNDLPGALVQIRRMLKPDGMLLVSLLGGETLKELRTVLMDADVEEEGGASPRVSPFADLRDAAALLQRAGFDLPVADVDTISVTYADPLRLFTDLRGMGEGNAVADRRKSFSRRAALSRALALYRDRYAGPDGRITATFQLLTLTAWRTS